MTESKDDAVGRRRFLTDAAAIAGREQVAGAQQPSTHEHEHQAVPSDIALRVKALVSVFVEKKMVDPAELDAVVGNEPKVHNLVVSTLCSCYPWPTLGLPPVWCKSAPYRSRAVVDPRGVMREFGLELAEDVEIRVWDSTAEIRYLVLPERPAGTDDMTEAELAEIVTRDSMIGVTKVASPQTGAGA